jgi:hypothetical protein
VVWVLTRLGFKSFGKSEKIQDALTMSVEGKIFVLIPILVMFERGEAKVSETETVFNITIGLLKSNVYFSFPLFSREPNEGSGFSIAESALSC